MVEVSVVMPCLNEEETVGECVKKARRSFKREGLSGEVIVVDNNSTDRSAAVAKKAGAKVFSEPQRGYGHAYLRGLSKARGQHIVIGDSDGTYNFSETETLLRPLKEGVDLVIGSRFKGKIVKGAMPWANRYLGNPFLNSIFNLFFKTNLSDTHSGFRAFTKEALQKLNLKSGGMEFALEMVFKASRSNLKIREVPITYYPRRGRSKLHPVKDVWRHLKFMLLFSPTWLFLLPGFLLFGFGLFVLLLLLPGPFFFLDHGFDVHTMAIGAFLSLLGFQILNLGLFAKIYSFTRKLECGRGTEWFLKNFRLEQGLYYGFLIFLLGLWSAWLVFYRWWQASFGALSEVRLIILATTLMMVGIQAIFSSFFLSIIVGEEE